MRIRTEFCWGTGGNPQTVNNIEYSCHPGSGWTLAASQGVKDSLYKYQAWAVCKFVKGNATHEVVYKHSWATKDRYEAYRQGCSSAAEDLITDCSGSNPLHWQTWGFEAQLIDLRPPAPPQERRWVQGRIVNWQSDARVRTSRITVNGANVPINGDGTFSANLPGDWPREYPVHLTMPANFTARWSACSNNTSCHGSTQPLTEDLRADPKPGRYLDIRYYLDPKPSTIQGFRLKGQDHGSYTDPFVRNLNVYVDGQPAWRSSTDSTYSAQVPEGTHTISVDVPSGWAVGYTLCINAVTCHNNPPTMGSSVTVNAPSGGYVDLWWHYYQTGTIQGFKMKGQNIATAGDPLIRAQNVYIDNQPQWFRPDFAYEKPGLVPGPHTVRVDVPAGWSVKYTACVNWTGCHDFIPNPGSSVTVNVPAGGYVDLWWHYYKN